VSQNQMMNVYRAACASIDRISIVVMEDLEGFKGTGLPLTGTPGEDDRTLRCSRYHSIQTGALAAPACQEGTIGVRTGDYKDELCVCVCVCVDLGIWQAREQAQQA